MEEVKTLVVNNFQGSMTPYLEGSINSGKAYVNDVSGYDPFIKPGNLTWNESAVQIDPNGSVITDLILAGKVRVESGITYVYAVGHTGRVYKIQVNDPTTYDPDYDNPVLLTTLTSGTPTFTRGAFIDFFGQTEKMFISHDKGVTSLNFDGTGEAVVGSAVSWTQTVPKPLQQFLGNLYVGNGSNIAEIISAGTVSTYTKLSPGFPTNSQVRDMRVTPDGNYLTIAVAEQALGDVTVTTIPTTIIGPTDSYVFKWNGTDTGYTSFITYPGVTISSMVLFGEQQYVFGYDDLGAAVYNPINKMLSSSALSVFGESPFPNAVFPMSNTLAWATNLPYGGFNGLLFNRFGTVSTYEIQAGYWSPYFQYASGDETDIIHIPYMGVVSNYAEGKSDSGYTNNVFGTPKTYFSTLESSAAPTTAYKFWRWHSSPIGLGSAMTDFTAVYQTQNEVFEKKVKIGEVRIYGEPWVANNSFVVELIGSDGQVIAGSTKTFTAGSNLTIGANYCWYTPQIQPVYSIGIRITNEGTANNTIVKAEIDYVSGGK